MIIKCNGGAGARVRVRMRGELAIELAEQRDALVLRSGQFCAWMSQRNRRNYVWNAIPAARALGAHVFRPQYRAQRSRR
jgi:hypothetical protein